MWLLFRWHYNQSFSKEEIEAAFEPITSKYGIKIVYEIKGDFFTPMKNPVGPAGPHLDSKVKPIRHRVLMRYPVILQKAFDKYPESVIKNSLNAIYFADEIDHDGRIYGGTYDIYRRIIYLVDNGAKNDCQAMGTFHHELSSILMRRYSFWTNFWTNQWIDQNPKGFKYFDDIYDSWKEVDEASEAFAIEACYEEGFVAEYGLTNLENDFNEYSAIIFTYPKKFRKIMNQYPRVRDKFLVWLEFYQRIDPIFTEEYLFSKGGKADK
jgi:hypothetical protein